MKRLFLLFSFCLAANCLAQDSLNVSKISELEIPYDGTIESIVLYQDYAYIRFDNPTAWEEELIVIDLSDNTNPQILNHFSGFFIFDTFGSCAIGYSWEYLDQPAIFDLSNPSLPTLIAPVDVELMMPYWGWEIVCAGNYGYMVSEEDGFIILDLTDPMNVFEVSRFEMDYALSIVVSNGMAYIGSNSPQENFWILDISDPSYPLEIASYDAGDLVVLISVDQDLACLYVPGSGINIYDISNPSTAYNISNIIYLNVITGLEVSGEHLFLTDRSDGLIIYSSLPNWISSGFFEIPAFSYAMAREENVVLIGSSSDLNSTLYVLDASDALPVESQNFQLTPAHFNLYTPYPSPFNPSTSISFALPVASRVSLNVYDVSGRLVAEIIEGFRQAGRHEVTFDATGLSSGVYLYRLQAGDFIGTGKMVLLK